MKAPIHSEKHYVQTSLSTVAAGTILNIPLISGVTVADKDTANEVVEGSVVKAVFLEYWLRASAAEGAVLVSLVKNPEFGSMTFVEHVALNAYTNKKNVLYHTQGLTNDDGADAIPFVRGWFKIPKGKQRFGLGDLLQLAISAQALAVDVCGFCVYKEYT